MLSQVATIDGGTARRIGDDHAVTEQLRRQLDVGGFAAACASAGELEQGLEELRILNLMRGEGLAVRVGDGIEERPIFCFLFPQRGLG